MKPTLEVTDATFDSEVLKATKPVVVDFWAEWCGPCKMIAPVLDEIAREQAGRAVIAKVNVDTNPELVSRLGIQSIPTLIYFSGGEIRDQSIGAVSKKAILTKLQALTNPSSTGSSS